MNHSSNNYHLKLNNQGEELKKIIGAAVYIECSSKTQQVWKQQ